MATEYALVAVVGVVVVILLVWAVAGDCGGAGWWRLVFDRSVGLALGHLLWEAGDAGW